MNLLLDTHALLWILAGDERLSARAHREYKRADGLYFSVVSMWEIGIKLGLRRPDFSLDPEWWREVPEAIAKQGALCLSVEPVHCRDVASLALHHRDPFDRMLVVQARAKECSLLSCDPQLDPYGVERVW